MGEKGQSSLHETRMTIPGNISNLQQGLVRRRDSHSPTRRCIFTSDRWVASKKTNSAQATRQPLKRTATVQVSHVLEVSVAMQWNWHLSGYGTADRISSMFLGVWLAALNHSYHYWATITPLKPWHLSRIAASWNGCWKVEESAWWIWIIDKEYRLTNKTLSLYQTSISNPPHRTNWTSLSP